MGNKENTYEICAKSPSHNPLYQVVTINEATKLWGREASTLRRAMISRFKESERRKSGKDWLVLYDAMVRVYGEPMRSIHNAEEEEG